MCSKQCLSQTILERSSCHILFSGQDEEKQTTALTVFYENEKNRRKIEHANQIRAKYFNESLYH